MGRSSRFSSAVKDYQHVGLELDAVEGDGVGAHDIRGARRSHIRSAVRSPGATDCLVWSRGLPRHEQLPVEYLAAVAVVAQLPAIRAGPKPGVDGDCHTVRPAEWGHRQSCRSPDTGLRRLIACEVAAFRRAAQPRRHRCEDQIGCGAEGLASTFIPSRGPQPPQASGNARLQLHRRP